LGRLPSKTVNDRPDPVRRRGRPTKDRAALLGRRIGKAALDLFVTHGFETITMDAIAVQLGISKGTLYSRYPSKADLLRSIMTEEIEEWGKRASASAGQLPDDLRQRLRAHARTIVTSQGMAEIRRMERLIAEISGNFPDLAVAYAEVGQRTYLRFLAHDIGLFMGASEEAPSAKVLAGILLHTITGWYRSESMTRTVSDEEALEFADQVITTIMVSLNEAQGSGLAPSLREDDPAETCPGGLNEL
jgi:TetR/AcrR family transcriptional repressor of mexJK operon